MQYAVGRVRALADRIEQFEKASIKIPALTTLGSTVCEQDKPLARVILLRAHGLLPALDLEFADTPPPDPQRPEMTRTYTLRQSLYTAVARCDSDLAVRLRDSERKGRVAEPTSASLDLATAYTLLSPDAARAADFASRALDFSMSRNEFQRFAMFLVQLRKKNATVADDLFLRALAQLRAQSKPDSYLLTALGTYFFTYSDPLKDSRALDGMGFVIIGKIGVISLAGNRPNVLQAQLRAYLEASADVLSRPTTDSTAQQYDYAAAFQLLPKARQFAPDLAPTFDLILRRVDPNIPEQLKGDSEERLALGRKIFRNPEQQVEDFEKATDPIERERLRYGAVVALLDKGEYERARSIARDLDDKVPRDLLLRVVEFVEAAKAIERGPLESALVLSRKFSAGLERSLLFASIAAEQNHQAQPNAALTSLDTALRDAEQVPADLRPSLLLALASVQAQFDGDAAINTLLQAVSAFNALGPPEEQEIRVIVTGVRPVKPAGAPSLPLPQLPLGVSPSGFFIQLSYRAWGYAFPLKVKGVENFDIRPALLARFSGAPERAEAALSELRDESRLATALSSLASAYLEAASRQKKQNENTTER